jgi:hypothetical protein
VDGISWTDLDADEQRVMAMLAEGISTEFCDAVALLTLKRIDLVKDSRLTQQAREMLPADARRVLSS